VRVLYFSRSYTVHDHRFLSALAHTPHTTGFLQLEPVSSTPDVAPLPSQIEQLQWAGRQGDAELPGPPGLVKNPEGEKLLDRLRGIIYSFKPDLIQAGPVQTAAFVTAVAGFRPLVSTSWGYDLLIDAERSPLWRWRTRFTLKRSAAMVGDCETIRQIAISHGMDPGGIVTFPWGVDLEHFSPGPAPRLRADLGWNTEHFVVLSTRGWAPIYGIEELARGYACAARENPSLRLLMLGDGPQASLVQEIFAEAGVLETVHFAGQVRQEDLPEYYRSADLYVSASHSDGSSISLLEAMACGRAVLVSDIPGNREWVSPGTQGWWFPCGDAEALAHGILQAASQQSRLAQMGAASRQTAERRADWKNNFPRLLEAYQLALDRNPRIS
jgi:L-malate glycosyltransferase